VCVCVHAWCGPFSSDADSCACACVCVCVCVCVCNVAMIKMQGCIAKSTEVMKAMNK
jgi:hypothetical protein